MMAAIGVVEQWRDGCRFGLSASSRMTRSGGPKMSTTCANPRHCQRTCPSAPSTARSLRSKSPQPIPQQRRAIRRRFDGPAHLHLRCTPLDFDHDDIEASCSVRADWPGIKAGIIASFGCGTSIRCTWATQTSACWHSDSAVPPRPLTRVYRID